MSFQTHKNFDHLWNTSYIFFMNYESFLTHNYHIQGTEM